MEELTVFIRVKIESLNELSKSIPFKVNRKVKNNKEIIKIITVKKYLQISLNWNDSLENKCLLIYTFFGLLYDNISLIEYLNNEYIFKNLIPELVEKNDPPIITSIKKTNDRFDELLSKEKPILETLLVSDRSNSLKLLLKLKKVKKMNNRVKK